MTTGIFLERLILTTLIVPIAIIWLSPLHIEHKTSVDSAGEVTEVTTITFDYYDWSALKEAAPEEEVLEAVSPMQTQ